MLIINGSPSGKSGNCGVLIRHLKNLDPRCEVIHLADSSTAQAKISPRLFQKIEKASSLLMVTGTYWDSWGSPLQKFLEAFTDYEVRPAILGKPAAVITLMHSVGGKEVLSRLQGVLSSMGFLIPPLTGMTFSLATELAAKKNPRHAKDFWSLEDLEVVLANLKSAEVLEVEWQAWPVDRKNYKARWLKI